MAGLGHLPSVDNLLCFLAAAEHLNFRRAAGQVALTPTAFGERIQKLEEQLGVRLFERTTRSVKLTAEGGALRPRARAAVEAARQCLEAVHDEAPPLEITIGSRYELARSWLAPSLVPLSEAQPNWRVNVYCGSGPDILERLRAGEIEAIITSAPVARGGWRAEVLHPESYVFVGAPELLDRLPLDRAEECAHHTLLDVDQSLPLTRYLAAAEGPPLTFKDERYLGSGGAMVELAMAGHGVCVLPEYMARPALDTGALVSLLPERKLLRDTFRLIWKDDSPHTRTLVRFAEHLRAFPLR